MVEQERRKYFRFGCSCFGEARYHNNSVERISIKNISYEGMKIITSNRELALGENIEVRVDLPGEKVFPLVSGKIKWINAEEVSTELGLQFDSIDKVKRIELIDYGFSVWRDRMQYKH